MMISFIKQQQVLDYFSYKNGPSDLVRDPCSSLIIGTYISPICGPLHSVLGPFKCPNAPKQHKKHFLVVLDHFSYYKNGPIDLVWGFFFSFLYPDHLKAFVSFFGPFEGAQMPQNSIKKLFSGYGPIDLVRDPFSSLNTGRYIRPTCGFVCIFLGPFGSAQMPQNSTKKLIFWLLRNTSSYRTGLKLWLGAYFQA
jgi:hypothetical protein